MLPRFLLGLSICVILTALPYTLLPTLRADTASSREIVFLTLEIVDDEVRLLEWNTVPGTLKAPRAQPGTTGIAYSAVSATGTSLWQGTAEDPRIEHLEYPVSDTSGELARRVVTHKAATFTIRIPARKDISQLEFSAVTAAAKSAPSQASRNVPLGIIDWPGTRQGQLK